MNTVKVAVYVSGLTVSGLINKARLVTQRVTDNPTVFTNCAVINPKVIQAITDLEAAQAETGDGAKSKIAYMHDKQQELEKLMVTLGRYIEEAANGDESIVHLAGLDVVSRSAPAIPDFKVEQGDHAGSVNIKVKSRRQKTMYRWEHSSDAASWISDGVTGVCKTTIAGLAKGVYWFRVILIDSSGEHEQARQSFAVN